MACLGCVFHEIRPESGLAFPRTTRYEPRSLHRRAFGRGGETSRFRPSGAEMLHGRAEDQPGNGDIRHGICPSSPCVSFLKRAFTSATRRTAGTPDGDVYLRRAQRVHIVDLTQTVPMLDAALNACANGRQGGPRSVRRHQAAGGSSRYRDAAERSAQYYMNHRWLGGTLTNWKTVSNSISRLKQLGRIWQRARQGFTKTRDAEPGARSAQAAASLGGIREMGGVPDMLFVIDTNKEELAIAEAKQAGYSGGGDLDTNSIPAAWTFRSPATTTPPRDCALLRSVGRCRDRRHASQWRGQGFDLGELEELRREDALESSGGREPPREAGRAAGAEEAAALIRAAAAARSATTWPVYPRRAPWGTK